MYEIINRVASSPLITFDLEESLNHPKKIEDLDIKNFLYQGLIIKEKEFREQIKTKDWTIYQNSVVAVHCSVDAIVPNWAYMLFAVALNDNCLYFEYTSLDEILEKYYIEQLEKYNFFQFQEKKVVLKGCGKLNIPQNIYLIATKKLLPFVQTLMYGEPCSTVPVYKKKK